MKFNKWTLGLAAVGAVSFASVSQAAEQMVLASGAQAAMTATTISGYVDTSVQWNPGSGNANLPAYSFGGPSKADGFNLNVVQLTVSKALDESEWAAGYRADLWFGPDANGAFGSIVNGNGSASGSGLGTGSPHSGDVGYENQDFAIRQAYVALRTPLGNGIDWKIGVFDTVVGYETLESGNNPNFTRSYGFSIEPTTHTGVLGTYRFCDAVSASFGIANTFGPSINDKANSAIANGNTLGTGGTRAESFKTYMGSVALTAPSDWGWVAGSSLYAGVIYGSDAAAGAATGHEARHHYYLGSTLSTPVAGLKVGAAFDYNHVQHVPNASGAIDDQYVYGVYASFQATEKLSLHGRAEYFNQETASTAVLDQKFYEFTLTAQYDLWKNVISRAEFRWDNAGKRAYGYGDATLPNQRNAVMLAANIIYKF